MTIINNKQDDLESIYNLAEAYYHLEDYEKALQYFKQFNKINPDEINTYIDLNIILMKMDNKKRGIILFKSFKS